MTVEAKPDLTAQDVTINGNLQTPDDDVLTGAQSYTACSENVITFDAIKNYTSSTVGAERYRIEYEFGSDITISGQTTDVFVDNQLYTTNTTNSNVSFTPVNSSTSPSNVVVKLTPYIRRWRSCDYHDNR